MARTVTLAQLRADARLYADQRVHTPGASTFVTDTELDRLINLQLAELHELFLSARGADYTGGIAEATIPLVSGTARYALPVDFFQLLGAEIIYSDQHRQQVVSASSHRAAERLQLPDWDHSCRKWFRIRGPQIEILPTPKGTADLVLQYAPAFVDLASPSDTYDGVNGWEKLVALGVAIELRTIEGRDLGRLPALFDAQRQRIEELVEERQAADPLQILDVEERSRPWFYVD